MVLVNKTWRLVARYLAWSECGIALEGAQSALQVPPPYLYLTGINHDRSPRTGYYLTHVVLELELDTLLAGLGLDTNAGRALVNNLGKAQAKKFTVNQRYKKQLSVKFRSERRRLEGLLVTSATDGEVRPLQ